MTLQSSPPINMQQIYAEFGAPLGTPMTALVRGGAYVPNTSQNAAVPTTPPIGMLQFLGAGKAAQSSISPPGSTQGTSRGNTLSQIFTSNVVGGVGPFARSWSFVAGGANITIVSPTAASTNVTSSTTAGTGDIVRTATLQCIVTDQGNGNQQTISQASINWEWLGSG